MHCIRNFEHQRALAPGVTLISRYVVWLFSAGLIALGAGAAAGQSYPVKPIRVLITTPAGSSTDLPARLIAPPLSSLLGQPIILDNRENTAVELVRQATPDGYTLMMTGAGFTIEPLLQKTPYDPVKDFSPVTLVVSPPYILVVNPSQKVNSVKELIALAKDKPGALNFGSAGAGGAAHLSGELFKVMAGVNIVHVPYKGMPNAIIDLIGGRIHIAFLGANVALPHMNAGRVRALAITTAQPSELVPGLPTVAATLPGYEATSWVGMFAPAKTPAAVVNKLSESVVRVVNQANIKEQLVAMRVEVIGNSPKEFAAKIASERAKWGKLIKDLGLSAE